MSYLRPRISFGFTLIKDFVVSMVKNDKISSNRKSLGFTLMADFFGRKRSFMSYRQSGFTLIELLVATAIVVLLLIFAMVSLSGQPKKARDSTRKRDLHTLRNILEEHNSDKSCYPTSENFSAGVLLYSRMPQDPSTKTNYGYEPLPGLASCPTSFWLYAKLENVMDPDITASGCSAGCGVGGTYNYKLGSPNAK
ncbi:MAG: hypothetical protein A2700_02440 [Candidatus Blackburnbacteria bacterium RIFCSPHIGHO2_01_FULL_44_64]|nr:MAG: hypothetical protein A2700_02440 [Candidatus Blackburnbacteria bacterium RIFCSPHIGHO2_01_FULL_44_64]OGY17258.1 MAG: hypothetical protein A3H88_03360 [Candidatus Blackburnbacteria bacterium RIFCSPLOWO2_02_FULL_44_9]